MSHPGNTPSQESAAQATGDAAPAAAGDKRDTSAGDWHLETGVYSRDADTQRLKKLDVDDLSIAATGRIPRPPGLADLNDRSTTGVGNVDSDPNNGGGRGAVKPMDPGKVQEWLELRARVEATKPGDGER